MKYILICVEGGSSEPGIIKGFMGHLRGQAPANVCGRIEVVPLPLGGNQGYTEELFEKAKEKVDEYIKTWEIKERTTNSVKAGDAGETVIAEKGADGNEDDANGADEIERYIVCDYDNIDKSKTTLEQLREDAKKKGFKLIVTRPKIEYFIARHFFSEEELSTVTAPALAGKINEGIEKYNADKESFLQLPPYAKKKAIAGNCLSALYNFNPSFIDMACKMEVDTSKDQFTELPRLLRHLRELFEL